MTTKMLGQLRVTKFQNLSNLCIEHVQKHVQKHQTETVVSTLNIFEPLQYKHKLVLFNWLIIFLFFVFGTFYIKAPNIRSQILIS